MEDRMARKINVTKIDEMVKQYTELSAEKSRIEKELEDLKSTIKEQMNIRNSTELTLANYKVTLSEVNTTRASASKLMELLKNKLISEEIYSSVVSTSFSTRFNAKKN